jgi:hypothetical protein
MLQNLFEQKMYHVVFKIVTVVTKKLLSAVYSDKMHQCFGETCCLHLEDRRVKNEDRKSRFL